MSVCAYHSDGLTQTPLPPRDGDRLSGNVRSLDEHDAGAESSICDDVEQSDVSVL